MMLNSIKLKNFISHKSTEIDFDYGINVISGPNGAGKTSILEGISFSLFNIHDRGKKGNLINARTNKSKLSLNFTENGIRYLVEWVIERRKAAYGSLFRIKDGNKILLARGGERVIASEVEKIIGIDSDVFLYSIYIRQGEIENLVTETPSKRKQLISKLLGIEDLEKAWKNMHFLITEYEQKKAEIEGELKKMPELKDEIVKSEKELHELKTAFKKKENKLKETEIGLDSLQRELEKHKKAKEKFEELESRRKIAEKEIEFIDDQYYEKEMELKKAKDAYKKIKEIEAEVKKFPFLEKYVDIMLKRRNKEIEKERLEEKISDVRRIEKILEENVEAHNKYEERSKLLKERRENRRNYEGAEDALKTALKHLEGNKKEEKRKEEEIKGEIEKYESIIGESVDSDNLEFMLRINKRKIEDLKEKNEKRIAEISKELGASEGKIKEIDYNLSKISEADTCPICGRELTVDHIKRLFEEFTEEKERIKRKIKELKIEHQEKINIKRENETKFQKLSSINPLWVKKLKEQIEEIKSRIEEEEKEKEGIKEKVKRLKELDAGIKRLEEETEDLKEVYQNYESAKRELARYPPKEKTEEKLKPIMETLEKLSLGLEKLVERIGYKPKEPEAELKRLRRKKEEYDRNEWIAKRKPQLELEISELGGKLMNKRIELSSIVEKIKKLGYDEKVHKQREEELEDAKNRKYRIENEKVEIETKMKNLRDAMSKLRGEMERLLELEKEKNAINKFLINLKKIRDAFSKDGIQKLIRAKAKPMIERITREFFEKFNLGYSDIEIDDNYNIAVTDSRGIREGIEQISSGERVSLAISLRLSIARVLSGKIESIIMDEPTTHLDEERRKELFNILNSFFREGGRIVPQMILITHHREIEDIGDVIYGVRKKEGYSVVELAEAGAFTAF